MASLYSKAKYSLSRTLPITTMPTWNFQTLKFKMLKIKTLNMPNKPVFTVLPLIYLKDHWKQFIQWTYNVNTLKNERLIRSQVIPWISCQISAFFSCNNEAKYPHTFSRVKQKKNEFRISNPASTNLIAC